MVREGLKAKLGDRERFKATFRRYELRSSYRGLPKEWILLVNVQTISGVDVTDHLWFSLTKRFKALGTLYPGDVVAFDARVRSYVKGYVGRGEDHRELDYKLGYPSQIEFIERAPREEGYYIICPRCGHHNRPHYEGRQTKRCRRCGQVLVEEEQAKIPIQPKMEQQKLTGQQRLSGGG